MATLDLSLNEKKKNFIKKANNGNIKQAESAKPAQTEVETASENSQMTIETFKPKKRGRPFKGQEKGEVARQMSLLVTDEQLAFLEKVCEKSGDLLGNAIWKSLLFTKNEPLPIEFLYEYSLFVYNKQGDFKRKQLQRVLDSHKIIKGLAKHYKELDYNIGIKGVVLLYLLNYMKNYLGEDISQYKTL